MIYILAGYLAARSSNKGKGVGAVITKYLHYIKPLTRLVQTQFSCSQLIKHGSLVSGHKCQVTNKKYWMSDYSFQVKMTDKQFTYDFWTVRKKKNSLQGHWQKENPCSSVRSNISKRKSWPNLEQSSLGSPTMSTNCLFSNEWVKCIVRAKITNSIVPSSWTN